MALPDHESFPQPPDPSILAWRYIDTPRFVSLLLRRELHLGRVDLLPDKFEGTHTKPTRSLALTQLTSAPPIGAGMTLETAKMIVDRFPDSSKLARRSCYASCWHLENHESEAMWRLYCGTSAGRESEGVALVLPYSRLQESLHDPDARSFIGTVTYVDFESAVFPLGNLFNLVMHKRKEFAYENEARVICWRPPTDSTWLTADVPAAVTLPWAPEDHIERIVVSPYAAGWYFDTIRELVNRLNPALKDRIVPSPMGGGPYT